MSKKVSILVSILLARFRYINKGLTVRILKRFYLTLLDRLLLRFSRGSTISPRIRVGWGGVTASITEFLTAQDDFSKNIAVVRSKLCRLGMYLGNVGYFKYPKIEEKKYCWKN